MIRLILVPFPWWEKVQFHLFKTIHRKFPSNGKRFWTPVYVNRITFTFYPKMLIGNTQEVLYILFHYLLPFISTAANPVILFAFSTNYRQAMKGCLRLAVVRCRSCFMLNESSADEENVELPELQWLITRPEEGFTSEWGGKTGNPEKNLLKIQNSYVDNDDNENHFCEKLINNRFYPYLCSQLAFCERDWKTKWTKIHLLRGWSPS